MRVLVCGGRHYSDWVKVRQVLGDICDKHSIYYSQSDNWLPSDIIIITGACPTGADDLAASFAMVYWTQYESFPADWKKHGRTAGPIRNQHMLDEGKPDLVVAFTGGRGTADMVRRSREAGVEVREFQ